MARYVVKIRSPKAPAEAFAYMADLTNFAEWDPGVNRSEQVEGDAIGLGSAYDLEVNGIAGSITMHYRIVEFHEPTQFVAKAKTTFLKSVDTITVVADGDGGSIVTYDADLTLNGPLGLGDPLLGLAFKNIGDKAAKGMLRVLDGEKVGAA